MKNTLLQFSLLTSLSVFSQSKPNVIVILADDLGFGDVSAYGSSTISTPNIDRLASGGVCFNNGYATSATSTPSRYALMTGMYPWKNKDAKILPGDAPLLITEKTPTLPKMMKSVGYNTAAIGKWHLGMGDGNVDWNGQIAPSANSVGFDFTSLIAATNDRVPTVYVENGRVLGHDPNDPIQVNYNQNYEGEPTALSHPDRLKMMWAHGHNNSIVNGIPRIGYMKGGQAARWIDEDMADFFLEKVKTYIGEHKNTPFFLYYGLHQPHVPRAPHPRFVGTSGMGPRGDAIIEADWCVGELIDYLEQQGLLENTLIVFSSDNGPVLNDGYKDNAVELLGNHTPMGGLRGGKYSLYDAGTRVPFFIYWKDKIKPTVSDALVCQMDLYASFAKMLGVKLSHEIDSQNLLSTFLGKSKKGRANLVIEAQGRLAFRSGNWSMIPPYKGALRNETGNEVGVVSDFALFDLSADKAQKDNVALQHTKTLAALQKEFLSITKGFYKKEVKVDALK